MSAKQTITINGRLYDALTGLAVDTAPDTPASTTPPAVHTQPTARAVASHHVHAATQKSTTLNRKSLQRPTPTPATPIVATRRVPTQPTTATRSAHIAKFAPHPVAAKQQPKVMDIGPVSHPHVVKAHAASHAKATAPAGPVHKPSHVIKNEIIQHAVENTHKPHPAKKRFQARHPRTMSIITTSIALVVLGGYLTYINMPSLSVRVASAQAGINATYPEYRPDGYSLNGAVAYDQGEVSMKFASNGGPQQFTIKQTKSGWDSAAVLDNYVTPKAGVSYIPYTERGLTIYTYNGNAAWVNGGILYTVEGNAPLSSEQLRRIATSFM